MLKLMEVRCEHNWQRSQEVTTELGRMFDLGGILYPVYIFPEKHKNKDDRSVPASFIITKTSSLKYFVEGSDGPPG